MNDDDFRIQGPGDDSGSILLECQQCRWSTEIGGHTLDDINDLAKDHHDEVHTA